MRATDLRDKVYSLEGVTRADEAALLLPDYSKTVAQVFAEATFASIAGSQNFDALFYATGSRVPISMNVPLSHVRTCPHGLLISVRQLYRRLQCSLTKRGYNGGIHHPPGPITGSTAPLLESPVVTCHRPG